MLLPEAKRQVLHGGSDRKDDEALIEVLQALAQYDPRASCAQPKSGEKLT